MVGRRPLGDSTGRARLLDAALDLFSQRGIANTTVAQIASKARVTSAMVHYWFDTREKLLDALVEERIFPQIREIWSPVDFERQSALEIIEGLMRRLLAISNREPWLPSLWLREIIQDGGLLRERVLPRIPKRENSDFRKVVAESQARGEINPDISPELVFISLLALAMLPRATGQMWRQARSEPVPELWQMDRHVMALFMGGLTAGAPHAPRDKKRG